MLSNGTKKWYVYLLPFPFVIVAGSLGVYTFLKLRDVVTILVSRLDTSTRQIAVGIIRRPTPFWRTHSG